MVALLRRSDARAAPDAALSRSILGRGVRVEGLLEIDGELEIHGFADGRIAAIRLIVAVDGTVKGDIVAREVVIAGHFDGRIFAPTVTIEATADIRGRIFHTTVTVARGARVDGRMPWRPVSYFETLEQLPEAQP